MLAVFPPSDGLVLAPKMSRFSKLWVVQSDELVTGEYLFQNIMKCKGNLQRGRAKARPSSHAEEAEHCIHCRECKLCNIICGVDLGNRIHSSKYRCFKGIYCYI